MSDVKHMKWWGWGVDGVAFHHENKPGFAPFVKKNLGLDLKKTKGEPPAFADIVVPSSRAAESFVLLLAGIVGDDHVETDDMSRVVHTFGKSIRDLIRVRTSAFPRAVDVVVYPANEADVVDRAERVRLWRELDHPQRDAFPGDPREWEKRNAETAKLTELGERLLGLRGWN
jgi:hypothetical protein